MNLKNKEDRISICLIQLKSLPSEIFRLSRFEYLLSKHEAAEPSWIRSLRLFKWEKQERKHFQGMTHVYNSSEG